MLSTMEDGTVVKGLAGIPSEGPVLFVGDHMLLGLDTIPLLCRLFSERNIIVRAMAHPLFFVRSKKGKLPDISYFDHLRIMGAVPVGPTNIFKLFSSNSHVLLYPGGIREAFHRKVNPNHYCILWFMNFILNLYCIFSITSLYLSLCLCSEISCIFWKSVIIFFGLTYSLQHCNNIRVKSTNCSGPNNPSL